MRAVVLACVLAAGALTACGGSSSAVQQDAGLATDGGGRDGPVVQADAAPPGDGAVQTDGPLQTDGPAQTDAGAKGHTGSGAVVGAVKASSANYKLVGSVTSGRGTAGSTTYKYRGGVVGATQKP